MIYNTNNLNKINNIKNICQYKSKLHHHLQLYKCMTTILSKPVQYSSQLIQLVHHHRYQQPLQFLFLKLSTNSSHPSDILFRQIGSSGTSSDIAILRPSIIRMEMDILNNLSMSTRLNTYLISSSLRQLSTLIVTNSKIWALFQLSNSSSSTLFT